MQDFFDWDSPTTLACPNECVGTEMPEFIASLFCVFGTPASQDGLFSSLVEVCLVPSVCAPCLPNG